MEEMGSNTVPCRFQSRWATCPLAGMIVMVVLGICLSTTSPAGVLPSGFQEEVVFGGLTNPAAVVFSPDNRVFVAEKSGLIKVYSNLTATTPTIFADLRTKVHDYWDRGLLGLALDPDFPTTPYVYVLYTRDGVIGGPTPLWGDACPSPPGPTADGCIASARLSRLQASGNVMVGAEQVLIEDWCQQYPSHTIGDIAFGPDGALYVSAGDAASFTFADYGQDGNPLNPCGDPPVGVGGTQTPPSAEGGALRSQSLRRPSGEPVALHGAVLRVDPATGAALPDNPLFNHADPNARRIIAHGFRNPFRFAIRPGTSEIWVGDVGWNTHEEINFIPDPLAGVLNFGWPCYEGPAQQAVYQSANLTLCNQLYSQSNSVTPPMFSYRHGQAVVPGDNCSPAGGASISGLAFYDGGSYPAEYEGALFFGDFSRGCIWVMFNPTLPPPPPQTNTLILAHGFSEGSGTITADSSGYGHAGTLHNGTAWTAGKFGAGLLLDGVNNYVEFADPGGVNLGTADFTIEAWVQRKGGFGGFGREILSKTPPTSWTSGSKEFYFNDTDRLAFGSYDTAEIASSTAITDTNWHHVAVTFQANTKQIKLYIDGIQDGVGILQLLPDSSGSVLRLGAVGISPVQYFNGIIDELRVYQRTLNVNEILADMNIPVPPAPSQSVTEVALFDGGTPGPVQLKTGPGGDLFYVDFFGGTIRRIRYTAGNQPPTAVIQASPQSGPVPLTVSFNGTGSSDPDGDPLTYSWDVNGDGQFGDSTSPTTTNTYFVGGNYNVKLRVADNRGGTNEAAVLIAAGTPPVATIDTPLATLTWKVGDAINFSGHGTAGSGASLPASAFSWTLLLHHCPSDCHQHVVQNFAGVTNGSFTAPDHDYPSHLELILNVLDTNGLNDTESVLLFPQTVNLTFQSVPPGLQLAVGTGSSTTPFSRTVMVNSINSVSAPPSQFLGGTNFTFASWSDGGAATHNITAPANPATYTATYTAPPPPPPPPTNGLVGAYALSEGSGTATADLSGAGHNGTLINGPAWSSGKYGNGLSFDGVNDYIELADPGSFNFGTADFTIEAWVQRTGGLGGHGREILSKTPPTSWTSGSKEFYFNDANRLAFGSFDTPEVASSATITDTNWHHVAVTFQASTKQVKLYIDGVQDGAGNLNLQPDGSGRVARVGAVGISPTQYFAGKLDEIRIYQRVLTASEIQADMANQIGPPAPSPTFTLTVNNGTGSGSYTNGTVVAITANAPPSGQVFDQWTGATVANPFASSTTLTMPGSNTTVTATYKAAPPPTFTLTVNNGSGSGSYTNGTIVVIAANAPPSGQVFDQWTGATVANPFASSTTLTMPGSNTTVTATYKAAPPPTFTLTVNGGSGSGSYTNGTVVSISANAPPPGQVFDQWIGATVANPLAVSTTLTMPASNTTVTATYKANTAVAAYPFSEGSGVTTADVTGFGHTGTLINGTAWTTGRYGAGLTFDGTNDLVQLAAPNSFNFGTTNFTIVAWVQRNGGLGGNGRVILSKTSPGSWASGSKEFYFNGANRLAFGSFDTSEVASTATITDTNWHHVAVTFEVSTKQVKLYIDGAQDGTGTLNLLADGPNRVVRIGAVALSPTQYFRGKLDEIRVYQRVLTASEIQADMINPIQP